MGLQRGANAKHLERSALGIAHVQAVSEPIAEDGRIGGKGYTHGPASTGIENGGTALLRVCNRRANPFPADTAG